MISCNIRKKVMVLIDSFKGSMSSWKLEMRKNGRMHGNRLCTNGRRWCGRWTWICICQLSWCQTGAGHRPDTGCKVIAFASGLLYGYPAGCEPYKNRICGSGSYYIWYYIKCDLLSVAQPGSPKKGIEIEMFRYPAIFFFDE